MKSVKIIIATHKNFNEPRDKELYMPVHVGAEGKDDLGYQKDNVGESISTLNPYFCELTGIYWAWKNLDVDYLGLVHYRRFFTKRKMAFTSDIKIDDVILSKQDVDELIENYDVIVPTKRKYYIETLYSHYAHTFDHTHLDLARQIIGDRTPDYLPSFDVVMKQRSGYMFNMFIMKKTLLNEYCEWLFPILQAMYEKMDLSSYTAFEARLFGRVSERLFNVWLNHKNISPREVPFMYMEKVDLWKKGMGFLMAKLFGKKYDKSF